MKESDKKKLLALPFYLVKRAELPEPKIGQKEWDLFTELYGLPYNHYDDEDYDPEEKITEFNYENFIPPLMLAQYDVQSEEFKEMIKLMHLTTRTKIEQHKFNQQQFRELMPTIATLDEEET